MACSTQTLKVFALIWDIIYMFLGLATIGMGSFVLFKFDHFNNAAFIIISFGLLVFLVSLIGILGATRESSQMSKSFAIILVILLILQVVTVSFFWIFKQSLLINVDKTFDDMWQEQPLPVKPENATQIASIERWLDCCGNVGSTDYMLPPHSCYNKETDKLNMEGCRQKFLDYISDRWTAFNIFALVVVVVELICAYFAYVLANSILNRWRRSKYYPK